MTLKATRPVLYRSTQYRTGDALPADNEQMVAAWLEYGSAVWAEEDETETATAAPKGKLVTAMPGQPGLSSDGDPNALVGKVPEEPARKRTRKKTK